MSEKLAIQFEKIHRYIYDNHYVSENPYWGKLPRSKKVSGILLWLYKVGFKLFPKWRDCLPDTKKYKRYRK